jgi:hypothetical protein
MALAWAIAAALLRSWYTNRQIDKAIEEARATCDRIHGNPNSSENHKQNAQQNVERLEELKFVVLQERVSSVRATLTPSADV